MMCIISCNSNKSDEKQATKRYQAQTEKKQVSIQDSVALLRDSVGYIENAGFINAKLAFYGCEDHDYYSILVPLNTEGYEYLFDLSSVSFMMLSDIPTIDGLTIEKIKNEDFANRAKVGGLTFVNKHPVSPLRFENIKGFEGLAKEIKNYDDFLITEKKVEIIEKLKECYNNYLKEYSKFLQGIYSFRNDIHLITKDDYDFETQQIRLYPLGGKLDSYGSAYDYGKNWEYEYVQRKYKPKYQNVNALKELRINIPVADAKKLFEKNPLCETIITVVPKHGCFGGASSLDFRHYIQDFDIVYITKNFYEPNSWSEKDGIFIEGPILSVRLYSNNKHPFN